MKIDFFENFLVIAEEESISKAAEKLFLSRSALNRQLLHIEKELGQPLFKRTGNRLKLTYAGTIYWETANKVLNVLRQGSLQLSDVDKCTRGKIVFGASSSICAEVLGAIFGEFHRRYPGIGITPIQKDSTSLVNMLQEGILDFAIISSLDATPDLKAEALQTREVLLFVPWNHPMAHCAGLDASGQYLQCDLSWFKDDPFCMQGKSSPLYGLCQDLFRKENFVPNVVIEESTRSISIQMVNQGVACAFLADFYPQQDVKVVKFALRPRLYYSLMLAFPQESNPSITENYFLELITQYFQKLPTTQIIYE